MRKNIRYIIIAALCLVLLIGAYAVVSMTDTPEQVDTEETAEATDLLYFAEGEIESVEITPKGEETLVIVAESTSVAEATNCDLPLNTEKLVMAYASAINPTYTKRFDNTENLADYGFDAPMATVKINEGDGTYTSYKLGN